MVNTKNTTKDYQSGYAAGFHAGKARRDEIFKEANNIITAYSVNLDFMDTVIKAKIIKHLMASPAIRSEATKGDMSSFRDTLAEEIIDAIVKLHEVWQQE